MSTVYHFIDIKKSPQNLSISVTQCTYLLREILVVNQIFLSSKTIDINEISVTVTVDILDEFLSISVIWHRRFPAINDILLPIRYQNNVEDSHW